MKNKKVFKAFLFSTPILFFFGLRLLQFIFGYENAESLKTEIIGSIICGTLSSFGLWHLYRKAAKEKDAS
jgi:hypothetical protein